MDRADPVGGHSEFVPELDIPQGWRESYVDRDALPSYAWRAGAMFLGFRFVPENYVDVIRHVELGVFRWEEGKDPDRPLIAQDDSLHWWAPFSDAHLSYPSGVGIYPTTWKWTILVERGRSQSIGSDDPPPGSILPLQTGVDPLGLFNAPARCLIPASNATNATFSIHLAIPGPHKYALLAWWDQPPEIDGNTLKHVPWALAKSWATWEGVTMRYETAEARRMLFAGFP